MPDPRQGQLPGVAEDAERALRAIASAGARAGWWSKRSTVAVILAIDDLDLSGDDRTHGLLELALMGPTDAHDYSLGQLSVIAQRHRSNLVPRRRRLAAAGVLDIEHRPGDKSITRPGALVWEVVHRVEGVPTPGTPPAVYPTPTPGTPPAVYPTPTPGTPPAVYPTPTPGTYPTPTPGTPSRDIESARARAPINDNDLIPADSPRRWNHDQTIPYCRVVGCENTVQISRATSKPFGLCIPCDRHPQEAP